MDITEHRAAERARALQQVEEILRVAETTVERNGVPLFMLIEMIFETGFDFGHKAGVVYGEAQAQ